LRYSTCKYPVTLKPGLGVTQGHQKLLLVTSALCDIQSYSDLDSDSLASLYDSTITKLLDRQVPMWSVTCRRRPSSLWFDDECRGVKRKVRRLERAARREGPLALYLLILTYLLTYNE